jgi:DNA-binding NtrC family response regulator
MRLGLAMQRNRILIVDDSESIRFAVRSFLEGHGYEVAEEASCKGALDSLAAAPPDAAVVDYMLPDGTALDLLPRFKDVPVIVLTAHGTIDLAVRAIKEGSEHFLTKPVELPALLVVIERVLEGQRTRRREAAMRASRGRKRLDPFIGTSAAVRKLEEEARTVLASDRPVLVTGPTGSGKGILAAWLHENGSRAEEAFVDLNCAGLSPQFLETELFGHERGAFTGAVAAKQGLFEVAHRGTLFLDEVGDVDPAVQPKLLKVLEQGRFRRLGEVRDRSADVRLITATHQDLGLLVREKKFRSDLYFRISTLPMAVPALSQRTEDVSPLAHDLLQRIGADLGRPAPQITRSAAQALEAHAWPGNIRELRNVLERAALLSNGESIDRKHLRFVDLDAEAAPAMPPGGAIVPLAENERRYLGEVMKAMRGRVEDAARALGIPRSSLYERLRKHGITWSRE